MVAINTAVKMPIFCLQVITLSNSWFGSNYFTGGYNYDKTVL